MFYTIKSIAPIAQKLHSSDQKIVLVTGYFDLLHSEHIKFLTKAKAIGHVLIVAVESDIRARRVKGEGRPIEPQPMRCQHLSALTTPGVISSPSHLVDFVIALPDDFDHLEAYDSLISTIHPSIYAISSHTDHQKNKKILIEKYGGRLVIVHQFNPSISTTKIISSNKI